MMRRSRWLALVTILAPLVLLAGCGGGTTGGAPATTSGSVTLCTASVPTPEPSERACSEVPFTYVAPTP